MINLSFHRCKFAFPENNLSIIAVLFFFIKQSLKPHEITSANKIRVVQSIMFTCHVHSGNRCIQRTPSIRFDQPL